MAGASLCAGALWLPLIAMQRKSQANALPPPGIVSQEQFEALCIKCGLCLEACPFDMLKLASLGDGAPIGTPYFIAREKPCEMCADIPCVKVCPSGALDKNFSDITKAKMGIAVIDTEHCLSWRGLRCEVCYRVCPVRDKAITLKLEPNTVTGKHALFLPVVNSEDCTGCGKCEYACITEKPSIVVLRSEFAEGRLGKHYMPSYDESGQVIMQDIGHNTDIPDALKPGGDTKKAPGVDYFNR
jgi:ferredoxin-type protein NapG